MLPPEIIGLHLEPRRLEVPGVVTHLPAPLAPPSWLAFSLLGRLAAAEFGAEFIGGEGVEG
jgi:hypothetical protein